MWKVLSQTQKDDQRYQREIKMIRDREITFAKLFNMIEGRSVKILETGTIRARSWGESDGHSLLKFADHVWKYGGSVISIDNKAQSCDLARSMIKEMYSGKYNDLAITADLNQIQVVHSDSVEYLNQYSEQIDILYLDSANNADLILAEAKAAMGNLHSKSLILIDDVNDVTHREVQKGSKVIPYLLDNGWEIVIRDYQCLMQLTDRI